MTLTGDSAEMDHEASAQENVNEELESLGKSLTNFRNSKHLSV